MAVVPGLKEMPVLSLYGSDIIVYGADLRWYLLLEFADLLGLDGESIYSSMWKESSVRLGDIPFWGEIGLWHARR